MTVKFYKPTKEELEEEKLRKEEEKRLEDEVKQYKFGFCPDCHLFETCEIKYEKEN